MGTENGQHSAKGKRDCVCRNYIHVKEQDKQLCNIIQTAKRNFCLPFKFYTDFTQICLWILPDNCKIQVKCK